MRVVRRGGAGGHFHSILHLRLTTCEAYKSVGPRAAAPVLPPLVLVVHVVSVLLRT